MNQLRQHRATEAKLQSLAKMIEDELPDGVHFALVCFTTSPDETIGYASYVSNAERQSMIAGLTEAVVQLGSRSDSGPSAEVEQLHGRLNRHQRRANKKRGGE